MSSIYDIDFDLLNNNTTVPKLRTPLHLQWLKALTYPLTWIYSLLTGDYLNGSSHPLYIGIVPYNFGDFVTVGGSNFVNINPAGSTGIDTTNSSTWYMCQTDYRGVQERINYSCQKIMIEYILNREFNTTPTTLPTISITNVSSGFSINFPTALYQALGGNNSIGAQTGGTVGGGSPNAADNIILAFINKYSYPGYCFNIITF